MNTIGREKAVNVIKMGEWTSPVDFRYQDETSRFKVACDQAAALKRGEVYVPKPWESLPYLAKEDLGKIYVRGFLHDLVAQNGNGSFSHPASLSTGQIIDRLGRSWSRHARNFPKTEVSHQRLVFSLSREFHDALVRASRNPDMVLRGVIEQSMRAFQEKFHPGDSVGYSYGLHHDTDNLHAHVFVHPRTREGSFVGMSEQLKKLTERGASSRHKNQLRFLRETARHRASQVIRQLTDHEVAAHLGKNIESERIYFVSKQSHTAWQAHDYRPKTPAEYELEQKRMEAVGFDRQIAARKATLRGLARGRNIEAIWLPRQPKWLRLMHQAQMASIFREIRQLQWKRHRAVADYRAIRRRLGLHVGTFQTVSAKQKQPRAFTPAQTVYSPSQSTSFSIRSNPIHANRGRGL